MNSKQFINTFLNYIDTAWCFKEYDKVSSTSLKLLKTVSNRFNKMIKDNGLTSHIDSEITGVSEEQICINLVLDIMRAEEGFYTVDFIYSEIAEQITELIYENFKEFGFYVRNKILYVKEEK